MKVRELSRTLFHVQLAVGFSATWVFLYLLYFLSEGVPFWVFACVLVGFFMDGLSLSAFLTALGMWAQLRRRDKEQGRLWAVLLGTGFAPALFGTVLLLIYGLIRGDRLVFVTLMVVYPAITFVGLVTSVVVLKRSGALQRLAVSTPAATPVQKAADKENGAGPA